LCCWWLEFNNNLYGVWNYENYFTPESWTTQSPDFSIISGEVGSENAAVQYTGTALPDTGYFTYSVTDNFGCNYDTTISVVVNNCTDIENILNNKEFSICPNPAKDYIQIQSDKSINNIEILSVDGKLVKQITINNNSFNISDLDNGVYFVKVGNTINKFIKK
jgi:hypothetical protein